MNSQERFHSIVQLDAEDPSSLEWRAGEMPRVDEGDVLVRIRYAGVNRADTLQARGHYPPPAGVTETLGLEAAGEIVDPNGAVRADGRAWEAGDKVGVLLSGGGYATHVAVPAGQLLDLPGGCDLAETCALIEVATTVWSNLMMTARVKEGDLVLIHGGAGGVGLFAVQLCRALGARVSVTAGSVEKLELCREYGAEILINYREENFAEVLRKHGGADVILDIIGAKYLGDNVRALAKDGHIVTIGLQGGVKGELNLGALLAQRGTISATGLRYRDKEDKARIVRETVEHVWPLVAEGTIRPHIDRTMPVAEAAEAHRVLLNGEVSGKIILRVE